MKAIMKYKLPDEEYEYHQAVNAGRYAGALTDIWNKFRELEKYGDRDTISVSDARQIVIDIFEANNINFDGL
jgi:hypothetical protein